MEERISSEEVPPLKKQKSDHSTLPEDSKVELASEQIESKEIEKTEEAKETEETEEANETNETEDSEETETERHEIVYIHSNEYTQLCNSIPVHRNRALIVHSLLEAYGLLNTVKIVSPEAATDDQLTAYHSDEYIDKIKALSKSVPTIQESKEVFQQREDFGLAFDCPPFRQMYEYVQMVAGATLVGACMLNEGECRIAINTEGGRHHGKKDQASGFCYINDIVIGILKLLEKFRRVLYIDIDIHHGDGVEEAFYLTNKVVTLSLHKHCKGFFPGTGGSSSIGSGRGKNHCINVPIPDNVDDEIYFRIFRELTNEVRSKFAPEVVVLQCGCDTLTGDPLGEWNLTPKVVGACAKWISDWQLPTLVLGGGGYNPANVARAWVYVLDALTKNAPPSTYPPKNTADNLASSEAVAKTTSISSIPDDIPEHAFFELYGPDFRLPVSAASRNTAWKEEDLSNIMEAAKKTISFIQPPA